MVFQLPLASSAKALAIAFAIASLSATSFALALALAPQSRAPATALRHQTRPSSDGADPSGEGAPPPPSVLCAGEALWDSLPSGVHLGGAPSNVAAHLAALFRSPDRAGGPTVAVAACLGDDEPGREARRRLLAGGVRADFLQVHPSWDTGAATAVLDGRGDAAYEFNTPAAWDGLRLDDRLAGLVRDGGGGGGARSAAGGVLFVMGTIAGRLRDGDGGATSSSTLAAMRNGAPEGTVVLDVNLRSPWYTPESVLKLARGDAPGSEGQNANKLALLKLNEEELGNLEEWCDLKSASSTAIEDDGLTGTALEGRMGKLATRLNTRRVCVTRGKDGAALYCEGQNGDESSTFHENPGIEIADTGINDSDTVGAGDAFLASLVDSLFIRSESPERALERACALGGYVAGCRGATPEHDDAPYDLRQVFSDSM